MEPFEPRHFYFNVSRNTRQIALKPWIDLEFSYGTYDAGIYVSIYFVSICLAISFWKTRS